MIVEVRAARATLAIAEISRGRNTQRAQSEQITSRDRVYDEQRYIEDGTGDGRTIPLFSLVRHDMHSE